MNRPTRRELMIELAVRVAMRSTCTRAAVGSVITNLDLTQVVALGYNGNYRGGPNRCDNPDQQGSCGCIHAEANALVKSPYLPGQLVLFGTTCPCVSCAKLIINSGIEQVFVNEWYRDPTGLELLQSSGVIVKKITIEKEGPR